MKDFRRVFKYIWPQWPRVIVVLFSAVIVSSLLSLSFMTVIPLLKVMMGQEGIHGWVERKISAHRYGISFSVPQHLDFVESDNDYYLRVSGIKKDSPAQKAGLQRDDVIIGAGSLLARERQEIFSPAKLLEELATIPGESKLSIQLLRINQEDAAGIKVVTFKID